MTLADKINKILKEITSLANIENQDLFVEALYLGFDGRHEDAIRALDDALYVTSPTIEKKAKSHLLAFKCLALQKLGRDQESLDVIDEAIEKNPDSPFNYVLEAEALHNLGKYEEALDALNEALEKQEEADEPEILWNKADVLGHLGKNKEALKEYEKMLEIDPDDPSLWWGKSDELLELGKTDEALKMCEKGLEIDPDDVDLQIQKGIILLELNKLKEALPHFDHALQVNPAEELAWYNKACTLSLLNRQEEALDALLVATSIEPENIESVKEEEDLDNIKNTERFNRMLSRVV